MTEQGFILLGLCDTFGDAGHQRLLAARVNVSSSGVLLQLFINHRADQLIKLALQVLHQFMSGEEQKIQIKIQINFGLSVCLFVCFVVGGGVFDF